MVVAEPDRPDGATAMHRGEGDRMMNSTEKTCTTRIGTL